VDTPTHGSSTLPSFSATGFSEAPFPSDPSRSQCSSSSGTFRNGSREGWNIALTGFSVHHFTTPGNLNSLVENINRARTIDYAPSTESHITSFPALLSRHCTEEWLSPTPNLDLLTQPELNLYFEGVDTHRETQDHLSASASEEPLKARQHNTTLFHGGSPFQKGDELLKRRASEQHRVLASSQRMGTSIGSSSHRRRSSHIVDVTPPANEQRGSVYPSIVDRLRRSGHLLLHSQRCPSESDSSGVTPHNSPAGEHRPATTPRSRDGLRRERTPELLTVDNAGIYEAMTGSRLLVPSKEHDKCSEDGRPHMCADDMSSFGGSTSSWL
jgi:hypothetical protein